MSILALTSNTLTSPAAAGQIEYASPIFTGTPIGTQRGIVPTQQYYRLDTAFAGSNATGAQSLFGVGVTLSASTVYEFEIVADLQKTAGVTSHTISIGFAGTATLNNIGYQFIVYLGGSVNTIGISTAQLGTGYISSASSTALTGASANATLYASIIIKGTVSINAGGTFIPQYTLSAAPGGAYSNAIGSFIRIAPIGASGAATNVGAWA
jgi:hypothetical protein